MKLSISNIAWASDKDDEVYRLMEANGFTGLEIAPTRILPENPYSRLDEARIWQKAIHGRYGFSVSSMQSIWYGRQEKLFGSDEERQNLLSYTKKAIDFAEAIGCGNLVFGCPKNRLIPETTDPQIAVDFFKVIGDYAEQRNTAVAMEANPTIYGTNYVNDTKTAIGLVKSVCSHGFLLNLDVGTIIQNEESISALSDNVDLINHVHISEPGLKLILERPLHKELISLLYKKGYSGFVSIEMGKQENIEDIAATLKYVKGLVLE